MVHILSLIVLMVAAVPFVASDPGVPQDSQGHMVVMDVRDCGAHGHAGMDGNDVTCPGMMLHCVTVLETDRMTSEPRVIIVKLYHRVHPIHAKSIAPEAVSPPPRA